MYVKLINFKPGKDLKIKFQSHILHLKPKEAK